MTHEQIDAVQVQSNVKYELAKKIRALLDAAAREYGQTEWENDSVETEILDLVTGDA